jgi:hypothetical protein
MKKEDMDKLRETLRKLFAMLGSPNEHEKNIARQKIDELAAKHKLSWNDVLELVGIGGGGKDDTARFFEELLKGRRKQADILIDLAGAADKFRTADGRVWADIHISGHRETWLVRSAGFKRWLRHRFWVDQKTAPTSEAVEACLCHLEAAAHCEGSPLRETYIRVAGLGDRIYLDLCNDDWIVIEVDASGWRTVKEPPVRFHRTAGMLPLPFPTSGGTLSELRELLNVSAEEDFVILVGCLLAALRGRPPYPVLAMAGPPGASKSTAIRFLRDLIDPNEIEPGALPREVRDLAIASSKRFVQAFDNLSGIPAAVSDMLCRLSTGGGFAIRSLYTDDEETVFSYTRPVMLAGIEDVAGRHDLSDRTSSLALERIPEPAKKVLSEMQTTFGRARPRILGRLLDIAAQGLRNLPRTRLTRYPRMADYARWMAACETAEWPAGTFARAFAANKESLAAASLEADVVATLIIEMLDGGSGWTGTAKELLTQVDSRASDQQKRSKHWPKTPHAMASRLRRASEVLRTQGWTVETARAPRADRSRTITIAPAPDKAGSGSSTSSTRPKINDPNGLDVDERDAPIVHIQPHRPIVHRSSTSKPLPRLSNGRMDDVDDCRATLSGKECAYCGEIDPPPQTCTWNGKAVLLHADCEEYWAREHEAEDVPF